MSPIKQILHKALRKPTDRLNVITFSTHEGYQTNLRNVNANFYCFDGGGFKIWNRASRPVPNNHYIIPLPTSENLIQFLPLGTMYDLVFSQNNHVHFNQAYQLSRQLNIPLINLQHCLPQTKDPKYINQIKGMRADIDVFITDFSRDEWGWGENEARVVKHGMDTDLFTDQDKRRNINVLSVVNDFINRDAQVGYSVWKETVGGFTTRVLGETPGLSVGAKDNDELVDAYNTCGVFLNTATSSPIPMSLMEAMSCGAPCVSLWNPMIATVIRHGENGLIAKDVGGLRAGLKYMLENPELAKKMGNEARHDIIKYYSLQRFTDDWDALFQDAIKLF